LNPDGVTNKKIDFQVNLFFILISDFNLVRNLQTKSYQLLRLVANILKLWCERTYRCKITKCL